MTHAEKVLNQRQFNELLYWNLSKNSTILQWRMRTMLKLVKGLFRSYKKSQEPFTSWYALFLKFRASFQFQVSLTDLAYILEYKKVRLINFKTNFNAMSFEARRIFLYPFIACKFLIVINYTTPLYYFDRYQGASI